MQSHRDSVASGLIGSVSWSSPRARSKLSFKIFKSVRETPGKSFLRTAALLYIPHCISNKEDKTPTPTAGKGGLQRLAPQPFPLRSVIPGKASLSTKSVLVVAKSKFSYRTRASRKAAWIHWSKQRGSGTLKCGCLSVR